MHTHWMSSIIVDLLFNCVNVYVIGLAHDAGDLDFAFATFFRPTNGIDLFLLFIFFTATGCRFVRSYLALIFRVVINLYHTWVAFFCIVQVDFVDRGRLNGVFGIAFYDGRLIVRIRLLIEDWRRSSLLSQKRFLELVGKCHVHAILCLFPSTDCSRHRATRRVACLISILLCLDHFSVDSMKLDSLRVERGDSAAAVRTRGPSHIRASPPLWCAQVDRTLTDSLWIVLPLSVLFKLLVALSISYSLGRWSLQVHF